MKLSKFDLIDKFRGYSFMRSSVQNGHSITYEAVALDDIEQALDEFMDNSDYLQVISTYIGEIND